VTSTPPAVPRAATMHAAHAPIVMLVIGRIERARLESAVRGLHDARTAPVHFVERVAELQRACDEHAPVLVVSEAVDGDGTPTDACLAALRARRPTLVVVGYLPRGASLSQPVLALARAGVHELLFGGTDEVAAHVRAVLRRAGVRAGAARVLAALGELPGAARPVLRHVLEHAASGPRVGDIARALGLHRRTLVHRMRSAALPPPSELAIWARLLLAAELLSHGGRTVDDVAVAIGFTGANALRNAIQRHLHLAPSALRAPEAFATTLARFRGRMAAIAAARAADAPEARIPASEALAPMRVIETTRRRDHEDVAHEAGRAIQPTSSSMHS
jgi:AraC-like DNA-binding protein